MFLTRRIKVSPVRADRSRPARLLTDRSGLALIEFAFTLPILLAVGLGSLEIAGLAIANMRANHAAIDLADNTARMGQQSTSTGFQVLTESNINDAIQALRLEMPDLATNGRVTISSVEARTDSKGNITQFLHWQRCVGMQTGSGYDSSYDVAPYDDSGKTLAAGYGSPALTAPANTGLMYIELNYNYSSIFGAIPLLNTLLAGSRKLHYVSAMVVRQTRSTNDSIDNTAQVTKMTCDKPRA